MFSGSYGDLFMKSLNKTITERTDIMFIKDLQNRYTATKLTIKELTNANKTDSPAYHNAVKMMNALKELKNFIINYCVWKRVINRKHLVREHLPYHILKHETQ